MTGVTLTERSGFDSVVERAVGVLLGVREPVQRVECVLSPYSTSFRVEDVTAVLEDARRIRLVLKDLSWETMLEGARTIRSRDRHDPEREIGVYRRLLPIGPPGPPRVVDSVHRPDLGPSWLLLEHIDGLQLRHVGDHSAWEAAASWAGAFHACMSGTRGLAAAVSLGLPRWTAERMRRTLHAALLTAERRPGALVSAATAGLSRGHDHVVERLIALGPTVVHGQLYPSNIIVPHTGGGQRVAVLDWETAAVGPGMFDLAALVEGEWSDDDRRRLLETYLLARDGMVTSESVDAAATELTCARLQMCLELAALPATFEPPTDQAWDWLERAMDRLEELPG